MKRPQQIFDAELEARGQRRMVCASTIQVGNSLACVQREILVSEQQYLAAQDLTPWWRRSTKKTRTRKP